MSHKIFLYDNLLNFTKIYHFKMKYIVRKMKEELKLFNFKIQKLIP